MSYISHVDYKKMMDGFKKGAPKKMLKEDLEQEGNAFTAGLAKAKKGQEFKIGDKAVKDTSNYDANIKEGDDAVDAKLTKIASFYADKAIKHEEIEKIVNALVSQGHEVNIRYAQEFLKSHGVQLDEVKESHPANDQWHEEFQAAISAMGLAGEAEARVMKALDHTDPLAQYGNMSAAEAAAEFVDDLGVVTSEPGDYDDYDADYEEPRDDFDLAGGDFNDGEFWENEVKKLQEIAGVGPQDDGPEDDNDEEREKRRKKREMDDEEAENAEREEVDEEAHADGSHMRDPDTVAKVVAEKHSAELKPLYDTYQAAYEQYIQDIRSNKPNQQEISKAYNKLVKEFQNNAINWAGHEMLEAGMKRVQVSNLLSGYGYFEDWLSDYITAIGKELKGISGKEKAMYADTDPNLADPINEGAGYEDPYTLAKAVAQAHPELQRFALEDRKMFHKAAFKYANEMMTADGISRVAIGNLISGVADEDWPSDYITALGKELDGMEEGLHMPPLQATGQTIIANEDQAPFGMSVLSPDERKQLKEFIESYKTIKKEIAGLLSKAGKDPKIMENLNIKKVEDEEVPAERPAHYKEPTKTPKHNPSNLGGNRTGLVMTKAEMWEGEESIEKALGEKLHSTFNKVTQMAIKQIVADGFDPSEAVSFLKMEIEEKAKEATMAQYDF